MKRFIALALIILLFALAPAALAADTYVCFIALNDSLLQLTSQAYSQGGQYYVPASVFAEFRVYADYQATLSTARVYNASKELFFNISTGETYDGNGNYYATSAIARGASVYVPVDFVCRQFGLSWSYIRGTGSGDVCRITDGTAALTDSQFLAAARPLMASRYSEYTGSSAAPSDPPGANVDAGSVVFLSFQGLPSAAALDTLDAWNVKAAFFLTRADIVESPETVRRIAGEGHGIGILCSADPASEFPAAESVLMEAANCPTVMIAASAREYDSACRRYAAEAGLAFCAYTIDGVRSGAGMTAAQLSAALASAASPLIYLRLQCSRSTELALPDMMQALTNSSAVLAQCETAAASRG